MPRHGATPGLRDKGTKGWGGGGRGGTGVAVATAGAPSSRAAASSAAAGGRAAQTAAAPVRERPQPSTMRRSSACSKAARQAATLTPAALPGHGGGQAPREHTHSRQPKAAQESPQ